MKQERKIDGKRTELDMAEHGPLIICRLCDKNGCILNAYEQNSIRFTELTPPKNRPRRNIRLKSGRAAVISMAVISVEGHVSVGIDEWNLSAPFPFRIVQRIWICAPECATLKFTVNNFVCHAAPFMCGYSHCIRIAIHIETRVIASADKLVKAGEESSVIVGATLDSVRMLSKAFLMHGIDPIEAQTYQYTAISDGTKRVYTNADELKKYGNLGILSPEEVSYFNLYVNGVLQPKVNYILKKGCLEFITEDLPQQGATVIVKYIKFKGRYHITLTDRQYYTIADGVKREYTNDDALKKYSVSGIPGPHEVSYYNLYVNGVLQPRENYIVETGLLKFITEDIPQKGRSVILESIAIKDIFGQFLTVEDYQYDVLADESRLYCSHSDITPYGEGILSPRSASYQNLLTNAVNQPNIDYKITNNCLVFKTSDLPAVGSPITLQSVRVLNKPCSRKPCDVCAWLCLIAFINSQNDVHRVM